VYNCISGSKEIGKNKKKADIWEGSTATKKKKRTAFDGKLKDPKVILVYKTFQ
jgi:hypothetical protein